MNQLKGTIKNIQSNNGISLIKIEVNDKYMVSSLVIYTSEMDSYLKTGALVNVLFKETEVSIAKIGIQNISIQNRLPCQITAINSGKILSVLQLKFENNTIQSIITTNALSELNLSENDDVVALIKTNEVSIAPHD